MPPRELCERSPRASRPRHRRAAPASPTTNCSAPTAPARARPHRNPRASRPRRRRAVVRASAARACSACAMQPRARSRRSRREPRSHGVSQRTVRASPAAACPASPMPRCAATNRIPRWPKPRRLRERRRIQPALLAQQSLLMPRRMSLCIKSQSSSYLSLGGWVRTTNCLGACSCESVSHSIWLSLFSSTDFSQSITRLSRRSQLYTLQWESSPNTTTKPTPLYKNTTINEHK